MGIQSKIDSTKAIIQELRNRERWVVIVDVIPNPLNPAPVPYKAKTNAELKSACVPVSNSDAMKWADTLEDLLDNLWDYEDEV